MGGWGGCKEKKKRSLRRGPGGPTSGFGSTSSWGEVSIKRGLGENFCVVDRMTKVEAMPDLPRRGGKAVYCSQETEGGRRNLF